MLDNQRFFASLMKRYYAYNNKSGTTVSDGFVSSCCDIEKLKQHKRKVGGYDLSEAF